MEWIIGIDLGTTNCTMASAPKAQDTLIAISQCAIAQRVTLHQEEAQCVLPSFYYFPLSEEKIPSCVGLFAKDRGAELPERVIASAKSWLCHEGIDPRKSFLPLSDFEEKKSPVEVSSCFLAHLKEAWNRNHPESIFEKQTILITVPASFDPRARQLVIEATRLAGYPEVTLMEEPLAAFYAWLHAKDAQWRHELHVGDTVLVIDIGGGTTDFTLVQVEEKNGELTLSRGAVGNHLLLGGDNFDLALAHFAKNKFAVELDEWQFQCLIHSCRKAKEMLLAAHAPPTYDIVLHGRGSSLIGGTFTATLTREEVESVLLEGFFPRIPLTETVFLEKRMGIAQLGLPFVRDPRVTAHLAAFIRNNGGCLPTAILFNGGTMKSAAFRERMITLLQEWSGAKIRSLPDTNLDYGVSQGAVYYGWTRNGKGVRVKAGTTRSYYIGVEGRAPAVPGIDPPMKAVCLVPFGLEEGSEVILQQETFNLVLEEPAVFRFFSLAQSQLPSGEIPQVGSVIKNWKEVLNELHPIETILHTKEKDEKCVQVSLAAKVTEMGVLELWCAAQDSRRWKVEFDTRSNARLLDH